MFTLQINFVTQVAPEKDKYEMNTKRNETFLMQAAEFVTKQHFRAVIVHTNEYNING